MSIIFLDEDRKVWKEESWLLQYYEENKDLIIKFHLKDSKSTLIPIANYRGYCTVINEDTKEILNCRAKELIPQL